MSNAPIKSNGLRFDGKVALVTGAGGQPPSLGREYANFLASRGAKVVVNDLGVGPDGRGGLAANAETVAAEIVANGGEAVADTHSVAEPASARAVVQTAIDAWGQLDVVINNAGILPLAEFDEMTDEDCRLVVDSHLMGTIWICRAAWPLMREAGYGRIVNTSAGAMFGFAYSTVYGAAKAGIFGLSRGLALEGGRFGIQVNTIGPEAVTLKRGYLLDSNPGVLQPEDEVPIGVEQVAPVVAYLSHESCELNGRFVYAAGGTVSEYFFSRATGGELAELTIDCVAETIGAIDDRSGAEEVQSFDVSIFDQVRPKPYVPRSKEG